MGTRNRGRAAWQRPRNLVTRLVLALLAATALGGCSLMGVGPTAAGAAQLGIFAPAHLTASANAPTMPSADYRLAAINAMIAHMTLDQKLGQLFIVNYLYPDANTDDATAMFTKMGAGGVVLYHYPNFISLSQTQALTRGLQAKAQIPLIITTDEEGGADEQIDTIFPTHLGEQQVGFMNDPTVAAQVGGTLGAQLHEMGLNADFSPIVDVMAPGRVWTRAFGHSPTAVSTLGGAWMQAMQAQGVMATLKHFPGLGAAVINPHDGLPIITYSRDYIEQHDFVPYRALISQHPAMIMTTDVEMTALDPKTPAELSYPIVTGILRQELGYDGVVVTDALYMAGITDYYTLPQAVVLAIQAGNDMVEGFLDAQQMSQMVSALRDAVQSGQLTAARIDQSVRRILLLKAQYGLLPLPPSRGQRDVAQRAPSAGAPMLADAGTADAADSRRANGAL